MSDSLLIILNITCIYKYLTNEVNELEQFSELCQLRKATKIRILPENAGSGHESNSRLTMVVTDSGHNVTAQAHR